MKQWENLSVNLALQVALMERGQRTEVAAVLAVPLIQLKQLRLQKELLAVQVKMNTKVSSKSQA